MTSKDIKITPGRRDGSNWYIDIEFQGFVFFFRIHFINKSRKNAAYESLKVMTIYFEGTSQEKTCEIQKITDLMLYVERHQQWLLEHLLFEYKKKRNEEVKETLDKKQQCERCGETLLPAHIVWLEFSQNRGTYHKPGELPAGDISQGVFPFGVGCSRRVLMETESQLQTSNK